MLGSSFGLAITTISQAAGMSQEAGAIGVSVAVDATALQTPPDVLLKGYRTAQWTSFAFGAAGLAVTVLFLHGIGVVGSMKQRPVTSPEEAHPEIGMEVQEKKSVERE